ncbi:carbohydrate ABC transporter permease [Phyllobacterium sophorae]|jgi:multiple sugar transport system permease protein|uniref:Maltose/maltodextrin transport system permease protein MalG n=1 Tax=Phyllobacterium sophorae TaxID=1520277 RepID=A0A2P7B7H9_9HYPH|nr:carbohydrate ABC transporter permease [Phyllobacterium sophorae]PSH62421.1 ABC transporter permease [Phyllobacterium sophorae]
MSVRALKGNGRWWALAGCLLWLTFTFFPLYWVAITSFKTPLGVVGGPTYIPFVDFEPSLSAWSELLSGQRGQFYNTFIASTIVGLSASLLATVIGSMAAYALVRFTFEVKLLSAVIFVVIAFGGYLIGYNFLGLRQGPSLIYAFVAALSLAVASSRLRLPGPVLGNNDIVFWFVSQRMFPPIVAAFALFLMYTEMGKMGVKLVDTYVGLTFAYVAFSLPIVIWLMRDFFEALPIEVEEAAMVDNVPSWRIFFGIVVPMSKPGLIATFMITLAFVWNEFLFALFLTSSKWQTLPILVAGQNSQRGDEWWAISAAALVAIIPMVIMAGILSRLMRSGLLLGAIK